MSCKQFSVTSKDVLQKHSTRRNIAVLIVLKLWQHASVDRENPSTRSSRYDFSYGGSIIILIASEQKITILHDSIFHHWTRHKSADYSRVHSAEKRHYRISRSMFGLSANVTPLLCDESRVVINHVDHITHHAIQVWLPMLKNHAIRV
jgi:hypothetical protein